MPSNRSLKQGSGKGFANRAYDMRLTIDQRHHSHIPEVRGRKGRIVIRPPKPIRNAILEIRGENGISRTIYFTNPSPLGPGSNPPTISISGERALASDHQIVRSDEGMEKDDKVPEK